MPRTILSRFSCIIVLRAAIWACNILVSAKKKKKKKHILSFYFFWGHVCYHSLLPFSIYVQNLTFICQENYTFWWNNSCIVLQGTAQFKVTFIPSFEILNSLISYGFLSSNMAYMSPNTGCYTSPSKGKKKKKINSFIAQHQMNPNGEFTT